MTLPTGHGTPSLESGALSVISGVQQHLAGVSRLPLNDAEKKEAEETVEAGGLCTFCAGIHAGASSPACPRLASGKLNGDGTVTEFTYWRDGEWDTSRIIFAADIEDEEDDPAQAE